jgi:hypothetical protein
LCLIPEFEARARRATPTLRLTATKDSSAPAETYLGTVFIRRRDSDAFWKPAACLGTPTGLRIVLPEGPPLVYSFERMVQADARTENLVMVKMGEAWIRLRCAWPPPGMRVLDYDLPYPPTVDNPAQAAAAITAFLLAHKVPLVTVTDDEHPAPELGRAVVKATFRPGRQRPRLVGTLSVQSKALVFSSAGKTWAWPLSLIEKTTFSASGMRIRTAQGRGTFGLTNDPRSYDTPTGRYGPIIPADPRYPPAEVIMSSALRELGVTAPEVTTRNLEWRITAMFYVLLLAVYFIMAIAIRGELTNRSNLIGVPIVLAVLCALRMRRRKRPSWLSRLRRPVGSNVQPPLPGDH